MKKNLTVIGNSLGIIIEKPILDILGIGKETPLEITTDGKRLIIEPATETDREKKIREATKKVIKAHESTFRELAK